MFWLIFSQAGLGGGEVLPSRVVQMQVQVQAAVLPLMLFTQLCLPCLRLDGAARLHRGASLRRKCLCGQGKAGQTRESLLFLAW